MSDHGEIKSGHRQFDLAAASRLMADCGLFDSSYYLSAAGPIAFGSPIEHYLLGGWREGLEPSAEFEGGWLYPYFASAGFIDPPALTYATLQRAGAPVYATRKSAEKLQNWFGILVYSMRKSMPRVGNITNSIQRCTTSLLGAARYAPSPGLINLLHGALSQSCAVARCLLKHYCIRGKRRGSPSIQCGLKPHVRSLAVDPA